MVGDPDDTLDNILDIGEVARVPAFVENLDGLALEDVVGEQREGHVGAAPGSVDREETQACGGQTVQRRVAMRHELIGLFRRRVQTERMIDVLVNGERHMRVRAVHRTCGCVYQMFDAVAAAAFDDVQKSGDVAVDVCVRIFNRIAHARLGGKVNYAVEFFGVE